MLLSNQRIKQAMARGDIEIEPFNEAQLNPNSYNLRLHNELLVYETKPERPCHERNGPVEQQEWTGVLDMAKDNPTYRLVIPPEGLVLQPGRLYLGRTVEFTTTRCHVPMLEGRSSIGRLGMSVHVTAGFGDVKYKGHWTLELTVVECLRVYANVAVAQICYHEVDQEGTGYGGKYSNQPGDAPKASGLWKELIRSPR